MLANESNQIDHYVATRSEKSIGLVLLGILQCEDFAMCQVRQIKSSSLKFVYVPVQEYQLNGGRLQNPIMFFEVASGPLTVHFHVLSVHRSELVLQDFASKSFALL